VVAAVVHDDQRSAGPWAGGTYLAPPRQVVTPTPESEVLIIIDAVLAASPLASVVPERAKTGRHHFTLLVPAVAHGLHRVVDPEDQCCAEAEQTIRGLRLSLQVAAGAPLTIVIGSHDRMAAIQDALNAKEFGEVILATRSSRLARWAPT